MPVYLYKAIDGRSLAVKGTVAADTARQARDSLRARGLRVEYIAEHAAASFRPRVRFFFSRRSASRWAICVHELSMLLWAGIPLLEALDTVIHQQPGAYRAALMEVREQVAAGSSLAEALRQRPDLFDPLSIHLVEVGENAGNLEVILDQLARFQRRFLQLKDRVLTALAYPAFLALFGTAATIFLMTYVMPALLENLEESLTTLPWPTRVVKAVSDVLLEYGLWIGLGAVGMVTLLGLAWRTTAGRRLADRVLLRIPILGPMALKQSVSRAAMIISTLLRSGVVLTSSLQLAARSTGNSLLRDALERATTAVEEGQDVAPALSASGILPPLAVRVFSVGQETGRLEEMLDRLAEDYEQQVATVSSRLTSLLEPILIVVMAVLIGFVLLATILPILEVGNAL
ncbi:MAG: type II secretion system F family protein [Planctomycetota bacterium]